MAQAHRARRRSARATGTSSCSTSSAPSTARASRSRARRACGSGTRSRASRRRSMPARRRRTPGTENVATDPGRRRRGAGVAARPRRRARRSGPGARRRSTRSAWRRASRTSTAYFNFLLADEPRLAGWQSGALLGRPDAEGLLARLPAGDRSRDHRHGRLRRAQGRPAERRLHAAERADRAQRRGGRRTAACRPLMERRRGRRRSGRLPRLPERRPRRHDLGHELVERERRAGDDLHVRGARDRRRRQPRRRIRVGHGDDAGCARACARFRTGRRTRRLRPAARSRRGARDEPRPADRRHAGGRDRDRVQRRRGRNGVRGDGDDRAAADGSGPVARSVDSARRHPALAHEPRRKRRAHVHPLPRRNAPQDGAAAALQRARPPRRATSTRCVRSTRRAAVAAKRSSYG